jgi:phosphopantothenoylcysteine decarboxylase
MNILLGVTGSVAATLASKLYKALSELGEVQVVLTDSAKNFFDAPVEYYTDNSEWRTWQDSSKVLHIELRKWADVFVIAPLSANTLGKIANGMCDNLVTNVAMAWDFSKPIVVAPAMNTMMFTNPATQKNLAALKNQGYVIVPPVKKLLACGDDGVGAMAQIYDIVDAVHATDSPWEFPLDSCVGIPVGKHPGSFAFRRKHDVHTGVDLYCGDGEPIYSCTSGTIVDIKQFTGPEIGHEWWNNTDAIVIDNGKNFILYGECKAIDTVKVGDWVRQGRLIGHVEPVLPPEKLRPDIPGHSVSMLHLELMRRNPVFAESTGSNGFMTWDLDKVQPYDLFDPTRLLLTAEGAPKELHLEGSE